MMLTRRVVLTLSLCSLSAAMYGSPPPPPLATMIPPKIKVPQGEDECAPPPPPDSVGEQGSPSYTTSTSEPDSSDTSESESDSESEFIPQEDINSLIIAQNEHIQYKMPEWKGKINDEFSLPGWYELSELGSIVGSILSNVEIRKGLEEIHHSFKVVPDFHQYAEAIMEIKNDGSKVTFVDYWEDMYHLKIPGFPKPQVDGMPTFTPRCAVSTIECLHALRVDPIVSLYLQWSPSRHPEVIEAYLKYQKETVNLGYLSLKDRLLCELWGDYFRKEEVTKEHLCYDEQNEQVICRQERYLVIKSPENIPKTKKYCAAENPFPKMISKSLRAITVWELSGSTEDLDQCDKRLKKIKKKVLDGEISIPGIGKDNVRKQFVEAWINTSKSVDSLEHYHFLFRTDPPEKDGEKQSEDSVSNSSVVGSLDHPSGVRRRLQKMLSA